MSVTVQDLMSLPSLQKAKVLGGKKGLNKIVTSITVLEYANPTEIRDHIFDSIQFLGGELVITSFSNVVEDVEAQLQNIRLLADCGEVGLILYYVGLLLPRVDKRLIALCDSLNMVLICMPENDPTLQYSEVISETMDCIIRDQMTSSMFALDLVEQISRMAKNQQTVDTLLTLTSNRIHASAGILDLNGTLLSCAGWPRNQTHDWDGILPLISGQSSPEGCITIDGHLPLWYYRGELHSSLYRDMTLVIFSETSSLDTDLCKQALEGIRLGMNLWGKDHDKIGRFELLKAILQDEPVKMRRLAAIYHIDVSAISEMWILHRIGGVKKLQTIRELANRYMDVCICEAYEDTVILLPFGTTPLREIAEWVEAIKQSYGDPDLTLTRCSCLETTTDVKSSFWDHAAFVQDARAVFPAKSYLTRQDISFVRHCREIADGGEQKLAPYVYLLRCVSKGRDGTEILETLQSFLLDANCSVTETAESLFVHKNTIKYRLQKAGNQLGFPIGAFPDSQDILIGVALMRLLKYFPD